MIRISGRRNVVAIRSYEMRFGYCGKDCSGMAPWMGAIFMVAVFTDEFDALPNVFRRHATKSLAARPLHKASDVFLLPGWPPKAEPNFPGCD